MSLDVRVETPIKNKQISCPKPADQLTSHRTLAIYGNQDTFTSADKLRKWSEDLSQAQQSTFQSAEIDHAGHFWSERGVEAQAGEVLRNWLRSIS
ncbi:uncharacterized protein ACLA_047820 [Aspergillus clavatus NRRL 1]|uniref:Uncharacterized protein n=1 Tax=Aspergillus clavatus (strain ATCC 1007 / CBS 513.65 / DSM 816 / NCTC 3887 / NRRL 1 / QM 1276 / 107) TaxID=344612 RepID=A1CHF8_ASPCL|nr:uncharacterized protein ACLA_047820 [Aspergillus clavatus NRRL 1]EAW10313.1 hypothetical protein ACLA_047820 [Aspergillus clavatus NRRL 1]